MEKGVKPFEFKECVIVPRSTGKKAKNPIAREAQASRRGGAPLPLHSPSLHGGGIRRSCAVQLFCELLRRGPRGGGAQRESRGARAIRLAGGSARSRGGGDISRFKDRDWRASFSRADEPLRLLPGAHKDEKIPARIGASTYRNIFTGKVVSASERNGRRALPVGEVFAHFPVALLGTVD